jgi:hypothetical protein
MRRIEPALATLFALTMAALGCKPPPPTTPAAIATEPNQLLWGDTHVHSSYSRDAYLQGNRTADPDTAYRWAKGLPVVHPYTQAKVQIETPLDFMVLAHHAEALAGHLALDQPAWGGIIEAAERHYVPCSFTSFVGWEWTSAPDGKNLHRVVFMKDGREQANQFAPFSSVDSSRPEDLWAWLEETSARVGTDFLAIPQNPNVSRGAMFAQVDSEGRPMTAAYARTRMRWEPVVEVTQIRGDSETHPSLSPDDEFADFETFAQTPKDAAGQAKVSEGDYVRSGLLRGLGIDHAAGANPFKFGMIGSTDSHTGLASAEENHFWGASPSDSNPEDQLVSGPEGIEGGDLSAQGLAAVWAEENTRTSIFAAFKRKEVYATTGPRIRVRFFGGWNFNKKQAQNPGMVTTGYTFGHPMGSDLTKGPEGKAPGFLMYAVKDPKGANLDRIQLVKGWVDADGTTHEKVHDIVWSGDRERGPDGKLQPVENTVDLATAQYQDTQGAPTLSGFWSDPEFDPKQRAFYYVRVLQVPTPRHSLYDAVARGIDPNETRQPPTIQERAYTSPIWYTP